MVAYAQTGFCRWKVLLECFDEPLPFVDRCGRCDNCLRRAAEPIEGLLEAAPQPVASAPLRAPFNVGDAVKVARYGPGVVASVQGDEVSVTFPDRSQRSFLSSFLKRARVGARPRRKAPVPAIALA
jgi:ATP-dependent DNA helicase RecQ